MKGNIGLFISAGKNITGHAINIDGVAIKGKDVGISNLIPTSSQKFQGAAAHGILVTGTETAHLANTKVNNISSETGLEHAHKIYSINSFDIIQNGHSVDNNEI